MGGGWVGYVYVLLSCGVAFGLIAASTAVIYLYARVRRRRGPEPRVTVTRVGGGDDAP